MATIVTVHGTFSSGPLEGQKWWQRGSAFTGRLPELIEGADGSLNIEPFVWDGSNSETSRRAAGARLAERLGELEAKGEPYAVIGHSHGGSVVSTALLNAARNRQPLSALQRWFTVGTPFIKTERQRFLFSRLGIFGKAIYLTLLTFLLLGVLISFTGMIADEPGSWVLFTATFLGPIAIFYGVLRYLEARRSLRFNRRHLSFAERTYADRWLSLWHAKDEAVQCLKAVKSLDVKIFQRDFATSTLNLLAIGIIPLLCLIVLNSETAMDAIAGRVFTILEPQTAETLYPSGGSNMLENAAVLFIGMIAVPASFVLPAADFEKMSVMMQIAILLLGIGLLIGAALLLTLVFSGLARLTSHGLSLVLNPITLAQLKAATYGSDAREDLAVDAGEWPTWLQHGFPPLPAPIADRLEQSSDAAIALAVPKFRNIIDSLTAAETADDTSDVVADYLTWQELIHTSYFDQEAFVKLVAVALCYTRGFNPTQALINDPDVGAIDALYGQIAAAASPPVPPAAGAGPQAAG